MRKKDSTKSTVSNDSTSQSMLFDMDINNKTSQTNGKNHNSISSYNGINGNHQQNGNKSKILQQEKFSQEKQQHLLEKQQQLWQQRQHLNLNQQLQQQQFLQYQIQQQSQFQQNQQQQQQQQLEQNNKSSYSILDNTINEQSNIQQQKQIADQYMLTQLHQDQQEDQYQKLLDLYQLQQQNQQATQKPQQINPLQKQTSLPRHQNKLQQDTKIDNSFLQNSFKLNESKKAPFQNGSSFKLRSSKRSSQMDELFRPNIQKRFQVTRIYNISGQHILGGICIEGEVWVGSKLFLGPSIKDGNFMEVVVREIQRQEVKVQKVKKGEIATLAIYPLLKTQKSHYDSTKSLQDINYESSSGISQAGLTVSQNTDNTQHQLGNQIQQPDFQPQTQTQNLQVQRTSSEDTSSKFQKDFQNTSSLYESPYVMSKPKDFASLYIHQTNSSIDQVIGSSNDELETTYAEQEYMKKQNTLNPNQIVQPNQKQQGNFRQSSDSQSSIQTSTIKTNSTHKYNSLTYNPQIEIQNHQYREYQSDINDKPQTQEFTDVQSQQIEGQNQHDLMRISQTQASQKDQIQVSSVKSMDISQEFDGQSMDFHDATTSNTSEKQYSTDTMLNTNKQCNEVMQNSEPVLQNRDVQQTYTQQNHDKNLSDNQNLQVTDNQNSVPQDAAEKQKQLNSNVQQQFDKANPNSLQQNLRYISGQNQIKNESINIQNQFSINFQNKNSHDKDIPVQNSQLSMQIQPMLSQKVDQSSQQNLTTQISQSVPNSLQALEASRQARSNMRKSSDKESLLAASGSIRSQLQLVDQQIQGIKRFECLLILCGGFWPPRGLKSGQFPMQINPQQQEEQQQQQQQQSEQQEQQEQQQLQGSFGGEVSQLDSQIGAKYKPKVRKCCTQDAKYQTLLHMANIQSTAEVQQMEEVNWNHSLIQGNQKNRLALQQAMVAINLMDERQIRNKVLDSRQHTVAKVKFKLKDYVWLKEGVQVVAMDKSIKQCAGFGVVYRIF